MPLKALVALFGSYYGELAVIMDRGRYAVFNKR
jgi:hypothetical protein